MIHDLQPFARFITEASSLKPVYRPGIMQIRGRLTLIDQSVVHIRENHVLATGWIDYAYQWQTANHTLIVRWDNAHDMPGIDTSPYHQHVNTEENVLPSEPMTLEKVLAFIAVQGSA
ncbi:hypothetical protein GGR92_003588 [Spirosoma lacussanchae]|uniref:toxin-antitoxin system TumE family protein n=1 Tax=Spirosoma lacussanchae TaxID=1884249 RepID=UPI0011097E9A|nr:DUF6516 family protein [Spirosoma lacussanchae]